MKYHTSDVEIKYEDKHEVQELDSKYDVLYRKPENPYDHCCRMQVWKNIVRSNPFFSPRYNYLQREEDEPEFESDWGWNKGVNK